MESAAEALSRPSSQVSLVCEDPNASFQLNPGNLNIHVLEIKQRFGIDA